MFGCLFSPEQNRDVTYPSGQDWEWTWAPLGAPPYQFAVRFPCLYWFGLGFSRERVMWLFWLYVWSVFSRWSHIDAFVGHLWNVKVWISFLSLHLCKKLLGSTGEKIMGLGGANVPRLFLIVIETVFNCSLKASFSPFCNGYGNWTPLLHFQSAIQMMTSWVLLAREVCCCSWELWLEPWGSRWPGVVLKWICLIPCISGMSVSDTLVVTGRPGRRRSGWIRLLSRQRWCNPSLSHLRGWWEQSLSPGGKTFSSLMFRVQVLTWPDLHRHLWPHSFK